MNRRSEEVETDFRHRESAGPSQSADDDGVNKLQSRVCLWQLKALPVDLSFFAMMGKNHESLTL